MIVTDERTAYAGLDNGLFTRLTPDTTLNMVGRMRADRAAYFDSHLANYVESADETEDIMLKMGQAILKREGARIAAAGISASALRSYPQGIVMYLTGRGAERILRNNEQKANGDRNPVQIAPDLWAVEVPKGGYSCGPEDIEFSRYSIWNGSAEDFLLAMPLRDVVRVETTKGRTGTDLTPAQIWQNPLFGYDGTPIPEAAQM